MTKYTLPSMVEDAYVQTLFNEFYGNIEMFYI